MCTVGFYGVYCRCLQHIKESTVGVEGLEFRVEKKEVMWLLLYNYFYIN